MRRLWVLTLIAAMAACTSKTTEQTMNNSGDKELKKIHDAYVVEFLRRNPTVNTYLGGAGLDPSLKDVDGTLRDHSAAALEAEDRWLSDTQKSLERVDTNTLSANLRIDREVALAQIRFLLHQHQVRRYQERALDTYTDEPFRAIDWQLQGMTQTGEKTYGTDEEWSLVAKRVSVIPRFLGVAQEQLLAGVKASNTPDFRVLKRNGIDTSEADAKYFEETLAKLAEERVTGPQREQLLTQIRDASKLAAGAYRELRDFVAKTFFDDLAPAKVQPQFAGDRFAMAEAEYDWALKNNFRIDKTAAQLYEEAWPIVEATQKEMIDLAREIAGRRKIGAASGPAVVRAVFDELSKDYPKTDAEMISWYRDAAFRLVDSARKTGDLRCAGRLQARRHRDPTAAASFRRRRVLLSGSSVQDHGRRALLRDTYGQRHRCVEIKQSLGARRSVRARRFSRPRLVLQSHDSVQRSDRRGAMADAGSGRGLIVDVGGLHVGRGLGAVCGGADG
jgi:uncharacterized protein (DUF885 family)